jgi:uncharacterized SAM-binding protein YcdF (DUF218 family)
MRRLRQQRRGPPQPEDRQHRLNSITRMFVFVVVICCASLSISYWSSVSGNLRLATGRSTDHAVFSDPDEIPLHVVLRLDAVLVLGGGVPESIQSPPIYVKRRCDDAAQVVQRHSKGLSSSTENRGEATTKSSLTSTLSSNGEILNQDGKDNHDDVTLPILCLSAGTAHMPQLLGQDGLPIWESTSCAGYLAEHHPLSSSSVYVETTSYDTIGNAYYARTSHTDITGWRNLLIVTNEFHMTRTKAIFDWIFQELTDIPPASSSRQNHEYSNHRRRHPSHNRFGGKYKKLGYQLYYLSSPNVGLDSSSITARLQKEADSTKMVQQVLAPQYQSLKQVHWFLTHNHSFYTANLLIERGLGTNKVDESAASLLVKQSYGAVHHGV